jgi:hypothetical protein
VTNLHQASYSNRTNDIRPDDYWARPSTGMPFDIARTHGQPKALHSWDDIAVFRGVQEICAPKMSVHPSWLTYCTPLHFHYAEYTKSGIEHELHLTKRPIPPIYIRFHNRKQDHAHILCVRSMVFVIRIFFFGEARFTFELPACVFTRS